MLDSQLCWSDIQANFVGLTNVLSEWNLFVRRGLTVLSISSMTCNLLIGELKLAFSQVCNKKGRNKSFLVMMKFSQKYHSP